MAIASQDGLVAALAGGQDVVFNKASRTTVAFGWFSTFDLTGQPGAGTLAGSSTAAGVVPTDATAGCPPINAFSGANSGYIGGLAFASTVACRLRLSDMVFKAGAYGFGAGTTTLSAQPSYAARMPGGDYKSTEIWIEVSTAFVTGTAWQVQVTYTNQDGTAGKSTVILPATTAANLTLGRMYKLDLAAGDTGVQKIESVIVTNGGTAMTAGAFNVLVLRKLFDVRVPLAGFGDNYGPEKTLLKDVFTDSALIVQIAADSTASGVPDLLVTVING